MACFWGDYDMVLAFLGMFQNCFWRDFGICLGCVLACFGKFLFELPPIFIILTVLNHYTKRVSCSAGRWISFFVVASGGACVCCVW